MGNATNICYFCGPTKDPVTEEHIWPKWVSRILLGIGRGNVVRHLQSNSENTTANWQSRIIKVTAESLCTSCNTKWLSQFENDAVRPLASPLMWGDRTVPLNFECQAIMAAWAYKMAMLVIIGGKHQADPFFRPRERRAFRDTVSAHPYIWVLLGRYDFGLHPAHSTNQEHRLFPTDDSTPLILKVITVTVGSLAMQVVAVRSMATGELVSGNELGGVIFEGAAVKTLLPVWPPSFPLLQWPPEKSMDHQDLEQLTAMWPEGLNARPPFTAG